MNMEAKEIISVWQHEDDNYFRISNCSGFYLDVGTNSVDATMRILLLSSFDKQLRNFLATWRYTTDLEISISVKQKDQENV